MITLPPDEMRLVQTAEAARLEALGELEHGGDLAMWSFHATTISEAWALIAARANERKGIDHGR